MTNIFTLEKFDDFTEKINLDDLYEKKQQTDMNKLVLFNKILNLNTKKYTEAIAQFDKYFIQANAEANKEGTDKNNIYPKLSCYEIKYALQNNILIGDQILWNTGQKLWNPNVNSFSFLAVDEMYKIPFLPVFIYISYITLSW